MKSVMKSVMGKSVMNKEQGAMHGTGSRGLRAMGIATAMLVAIALLLGGGEAFAEKKMKSKRSQGKLIELNEADKYMVVSEKGRKIRYRVILEGSVLTRTTSTMNAKLVKLAEIPKGAPVIVYWKPDPENRKIRHARKVDAPKVPDELLEEYE